MFQRALENGELDARLVKFECGSYGVMLIGWPTSSFGTRRDPVATGNAATVGRTTATHYLAGDDCHEDGSPGLVQLPLTDFNERSAMYVRRRSLRRLDATRTEIGAYGGFSSLQPVRKVREAIRVEDDNRHCACSKMREGCSRDDRVMCWRVLADRRGHACTSRLLLIQTVAEVLLRRWALGFG